MMEAGPWVCSGTDAGLEALSLNSIVPLLRQDHRPTCFSFLEVSTSTVTCTAHACTFGGEGQPGAFSCRKPFCSLILRGSGRKINHSLSFDDETFLFPSDSKGIDQLLCSKSWMDFC